MKVFVALVLIGLFSVSAFASDVVDALFKNVPETPHQKREWLYTAITSDGCGMVNSNLLESTINSVSATKVVKLTAFYVATRKWAASEVLLAKMDDRERTEYKAYFEDVSKYRDEAFGYVGSLSNSANSKAVGDVIADTLPLWKKRNFKPSQAEDSGSYREQEKAPVLVAVPVPVPVVPVVVVRQRPVFIPKRPVAVGNVAPAWHRDVPRGENPFPVMPQRPR